MGQFQRRVLSGVLLVLAAGCGRSPEGYRTYSESRDGEEPRAVQTPTIESRTDQAPPTTTAAAPQPAPAPGPVANNATPPSPDANAAPQAAPAVAMSTIGPTPSAPQTTIEDLRPPRVPLPERIALLGTSDVNADANAPPMPGSPGAPSTEARPTGIQLLVPDKEFSRVGANGPLRVSYDDIDLLKVLNMEPVPANCAEYFPDWLKALDGAQIRIRGFMLPPNRETGLPAFQLARDNQICCFGREPKVYDLFPVTLKEGTTTNYIPNRPFDVVGRFHIRPDVYRGDLLNLYEIEEAEIITR